MRHGANLYLPDNDGVTPLEAVIRTQDVNMLQVLLNHHQLVVTPRGEDFAGFVFLTATDNAALSVMGFLLEEGYVSVSYQNVMGETAMHRSLLKQKSAVTEFLRRVDDQTELLALRTVVGESCFHYAAQYSSSDELYLLLDSRSRWHDQETLGENHGEEAAVALLNNVSSSGRTALFLAVTSTSDSVGIRNAKARLLLDAGAKILGGDPFITAAGERSHYSPVLVLSTEVQHCLCLWLSEFDLDVVTKFCVRYFAIISSFRLDVDHKALGVLLSSKYAVDAVPLYGFACQHTPLPGTTI
ncbi:unnamed protein product [Phytophthora fragariaefolia]|uniref:Unnamed protein product n=1 Tax=Phytophthora fragariaefolia TaxID=1490495 RepID=A0A9W6Y466_9STRA|nr:unnamed protein product [Phytophthora fragariaefolia]